jgi:predicted aspartyl protease
MRILPCKALIATVLLSLLSSRPALAQDPGAVAQQPTEDPLAEVIIRAPEPRYVAPTRRDRIGRVWVPVSINGQGPFRLVLDVGASRSAITANVAARLGLRTDESPPVMLRGVTGTAQVQTVRVEKLEVGDLYIAPTVLPIVADAFGGAEGLLGNEELGDKRIYIDFHKDFINIARSKGVAAEAGFVTIPIHKRADRLLVVDAVVGGVKAIAIIDSGAQASVANLAMREAMERRLRSGQASHDEIIGATGEMQNGEGFTVSQITLGEVAIQSAHVTFGDMNIFAHWRLTTQPAILVGMDVLGLLDTLVIDYRRHELMIKLNNRRAFR